MPFPLFSLVKIKGYQSGLLTKATQQIVHLLAPTLFILIVSIHLQSLPNYQTSFHVLPSAQWQFECHTHPTYMGPVHRVVLFWDLTDGMLKPGRYTRALPLPDIS